MSYKYIIVIPSCLDFQVTHHIKARDDKYFKLYYTKIIKNIFQKMKEQMNSDIKTEKAQKQW